MVNENNNNINSDNNDINDDNKTNNDNDKYLGQTNSLFFVAVPQKNKLNFRNFCLLFKIDINNIIGSLRIIHPTTKQESLIIKFINIEYTQTVLYNCHGKIFNKNNSNDICHVLFALRFNVGNYNNISNIYNEIISNKYISLPLCPLCLERIDQLQSNVWSHTCNDYSNNNSNIYNNNIFSEYYDYTNLGICDCNHIWNYINCNVCNIIKSIHKNNKSKLFKCNEIGCHETNDLWICLICSNIGCGRNTKYKHGLSHFEITKHGFTLNLNDLHVWDYISDDWVHRLFQKKTVVANNIISHNNELNINYSNNNNNNDNNDGSVNPVDPILKDMVMIKMDNIREYYNKMLTDTINQQRIYYENEIHNIKNEYIIQKKNINNNITTIKNDIIGIKNTIKNIKLWIHINKLKESNKIIKNDIQNLLKNNKKFKSKKDILIQKYNKKENELKIDKQRIIDKKQKEIDQNISKICQNS